jgi:hypothetical protein
VACSGIKQAFLEELAVFVVAENRITIVASQDDVERDAFGEVAGETGHFANLANKSSLTPFTRAARYIRVRRPFTVTVRPRRANNINLSYAEVWNFVNHLRLA